MVLIGNYRGRSGAASRERAPPGARASRPLCPVGSQKSPNKQTNPRRGCTSPSKIGKTLRREHPLRIGSQAAGDSQRSGPLCFVRANERLWAGRPRKQLSARSELCALRKLVLSGQPTAFANDARSINNRPSSSSSSIDKSLLSVGSGARDRSNAPDLAEAERAKSEATRPIRAAKL